MQPESTPDLLYMPGNYPHKSPIQEINMYPKIPSS